VTNIDTNNADYAFIASAAVPTGTSGDIVVVFNESRRAGIGVYRAIDLVSQTPFDTAQDDDDIVTVSIDIPDNGILVASAAFESGGGITTIGVSEDYETDPAGEGWVSGHATDLTAQTGRTVSFNGPTGDAAGVAASWQINATPDAPANLLTTSVTGAVNLSWTAPASDGGANLESYGIWRATSPFTDTANATLIASIATTSTSYSDTSAVHGTVYYYRVTATNSTATSSLSNQKSSGSNSGRIIRLGGMRLR
jgi:hypothetical protein